jgi:hypothetical protein
MIVIFDLLIGPKPKINEAAENTAGNQHRSFSSTYTILNV